ncbi:MAG: excinuclease ABC subunit UvrC [Flavobacteriales bacterium]|nr:excinuclease ABC subunit UvrC [Flavobacteriales bacterium]MCX7769349.1 excinuclease ABC subunit UvrC [Flavobacteriales bacterium]MDW8410720.1 excinuclease ABC subunit UvrC [Flavobacteriales bacterium]
MESGFSPENIIKSLPEHPGVYKFLDEEGQVIYVGKARNLKARVSTYFASQTKASGRIRLLVRKIRKVEFIITSTESDALLLENNLIKTLQPRYNINLKDDKSYPYIVLRREPFPRLYPTRRYDPEIGEFFGPYTSVGTMRATLDLVKNLYKLRTCNLNLTEENIRKGKFKVCLEYHIGNCAAPCVGKQSAEEYDENIRQIRHILRGRLRTLRENLRRLMQESAARLAFEEAQQYKEMLEKLDRFRSASAVVSQELDDVDIFYLDCEDESMVLAYLGLVEGNVVHGFASEVTCSAGESPPEALATLIMQTRQRVQSQAPLLLCNIKPDFELPGIRVEVPSSGEKKRLLDLAARNALAHRITRLRQLSFTDPEQHAQRLLATLQRDLRLPVLPRRIECYDTSHFQGAHTVTAMACFLDGKPARQEYRVYHVKTVQGPDDYAALRETLHRRLQRLTEEGHSMPDLMVIDGGKGQLNVALEVLTEHGLQDRISLISIAKRLEEIYYPGDEVPLYLDKKSETLRLIQHLRDEAHRFGLRHYRQRHKKSLIRSRLDDIPGIGTITVEKLLNHFKSLERLRQAPADEVAAIVGPAKARLILEHLASQDEPSQSLK